MSEQELYDSLKPDEVHYLSQGVTKKANYLKSLNDIAKKEFKKPIHERRSVSKLIEQFHLEKPKRVFSEKS